jgi:uncharacterized repeat protein (TIGR01451 family)
MTRQDRQMMKFQLITIVGVAMIVASSLSGSGVVASTEGTLVWRSGSSTIPRTNDWDGASFGLPAPTADVGDYRIMTGAEAPGRDEILIVGVDESDRITGEMWNGASWNELPFSPMASVSESFWWSFAVAYEQKSSDGMIVWRNGSSGTTGLSYRVWDGSLWSGVQTISTPIGGEPKQMRIAANPHSNEMVLVVSNGSSQDYAIVWSDSVWGNSVPLDVAGGDDRTDIFVAYEQQSGHAMVVYGEDADSLYWQVWNGTGWSGEVGLTKPGTSSGNVRWAVLGSDAGSDRIALGVLTFSNDIWLNVWSGTSWETSVTATTSAPGGNHPNISVAFESQSGQALATYAESATTVRYRTWSNGIGWSGELSGPNIGATPNTMILESDPREDAIMLSVQNSGSDLNLALWDGTSWGAPSEQETDTTEDKNQPFVFLFDRDNPFLATVGLALAKTVDIATPTVGDTITYTIVLTNSGPDGATGVVVADNLPAGVTFVSSTTSQGIYDSGTGLWTVGAVANAASVTLTITCIVDPLTQMTTRPKRQPPGPRKRH